jgi:hypothetical protein
MKKVLAIALTLTLVFALAVSSSAASLASTWTEHWDAAAGIVSVADDGAITLNADNQGFQNIAIVYNDKVPVNNLEIAFTIENLYTGADGLLPAAIGAILGIEISAEKATGIVAYTASGTMGGNKNGLDLDATKTAGLVFLHTLDGADIKLGMFGGMQSLVPMDYTMTHNFATADATGKTDVTLKLVVNGDVVDVYINGTKIDAASFPKADVLDADGKAYLSFTNGSYGGAHINATIKTINGQAANAFVPAANTPAGPADIEVVAIAGAMIIALMAAAFVVKARKA